jgi:hypothetical protein
MDANDLGEVDEAEWDELVVACSKTCAVDLLVYVVRVRC